MKKSGDNLESDLSSLLQSSDPHIRVQAIRGLSNTNLPEALRHLEPFLFQGEPTEKLLALQNCLFFPFPAVKALLLRYIAAEDDLQLVEEAGIIFLTNPDPEVPFQMLEIAENAPSLKETLLKRLVEGVCATIRRSNILGEGFPDYLKKLKDWIRSRANHLFTQECLFRFNDPAWKNDSAFTNVLTARLHDPALQETFRQSLAWPLTPDQMQAVKELLKGLSTASPESQKALNPELSLESFRQLPGSVVIEQLALWEEESREQALPVLSSLISTSETTPEVRAAALRTALRLKIDAFIEDAEKWMKHQDSTLASAALNYLEKFNLEKILPYLGSFLKSGSYRLKATVLKILHRQDPQQAISSLIAMLASNNPTVRADALRCLIYFDFSLVRNPLVQFLSKCESEELLQSGLCFFEANPDPENLFALFCLEKPAQSSFHNAIRQTRLQCQALLERLGRIPSQTEAMTLQALETRFQSEQKHPGSIPTYSPNSRKATQAKELPAVTDLQAFWDKCLQSVSQLRSASKPSSGDSKGVFSTIFHPWILTLFFAIVCSLLFGQLMSYSSWAAPPKPTLSRIVLPATPIEERGRISSILWKTREVTFQTTSGSTFLFPLSDFPEKKPAIGTALKIRLFPYTQRNDGIIEARIELWETTKLP